MHGFQDHLVILGGMLIGPQYEMDTDSSVLIYNISSDIWTYSTCEGWNIFSLNMHNFNQEYH